MLKRNLGEDETKVSVRIDESDVKVIGYASCSKYLDIGLRLEITGKACFNDSVFCCDLQIERNTSDTRIVYPSSRGANKLEALSAVYGMVDMTVNVLVEGGCGKSNPSLKLGRRKIILNHKT